MVFSIAIIGAGPAGCMLARLLQQSKRDIEVTIFEAEASPNFRSQGGTLDLRTNTGLRAVEAAGLWDEFQKHARYDGEAIKMADKDLLCYVRQAGASDDKSRGGQTDKPKSFARPEIDRPVLRQLLYDCLPPACVRWRHRLVAIDPDRTLRFADDTPAQGPFHLVVGADGAWSKVRPAVSDAVPAYSGVAGFQLWIADAAQREPELFDLVARGSLFAWGDGAALFAQHMGDGSLSVSAAARRPEDWQRECGYDVRDAAAVRDACRRDYAGWDPRLLAFTQRAGDDVVPRSYYMLPVGHRWAHAPGVTLIGDAAHLCTPFAGLGVNLALEDALKLSEAIIDAAGAGDTSQAHTPDRTADLDTRVKAFEEDMFERATKVQERTLTMMNCSFFTPGFPRHGIDAYVLAALEDELGFWTWLAKPLVKLWFFTFRLIWRSGAVAGEGRLAVERAA